MGHYSAALALKVVEKKVSLGWLFLAAQLVDILLFPLVLLGIERLNIVENFTPSTHFELEFVPYTHSLVGTFILAAVAYAVIWILPAKEGANRAKIALVIAAAIFSHWFLDLIVHTPDLPLLGDNSPKLGFGVWNNAMISFFLEAVFILAGLWLYLRGTKGTTVIGKYGIPIFAVALILSNAFIIFGPPPEGLNFMALLFLVSNFTYVGIGFWLDKKRS